MKREDLLLREAARRGDARASLEMARRLFTGKEGFARNFKLGLAYLQQDLAQGARPAVLLVAQAVPLEILMAQQARAVLAAAAEWGCASAMTKLGLWQLLHRAERAQGLAWLRRAQVIAPESEAELADPLALARALRAGFAREVLEPGEVLLAGAQEALAAHDVQGASDCVRAAAELMPAQGRLARLVWAVIERVAAQGDAATLALPVDLVEACLVERSEHGEADAQFTLGCALANVPCGALAPRQLVARSNLRRAAALLLRAADAGKAQAWLQLFEITSDPRSAAGNQEAARFFLEKAACAGVCVAQRKLGALRLREATSLERAEQGVHWLSAAAQAGDEPARALLRTLVLPLPSLPPSLEDSIVQKVRAVDAELAARLALARAFHLTRREALNFNPRRDIRPWGVLIPGTPSENPKGRLAPAVDEPMKLQLQRLALLFEAGAAPGHLLAAHKARTQRYVFKALSIPEDMFFPPEIGRSWSHYGFGRHWAARAAPLLDSVL
jgi:TPR repeat protein